MDSNLQEVLDDLVRYDVAHIVCIRQLGKGNSSHLSLLQVCKSRPSAIACTVATWLSAAKAGLHRNSEDQAETDRLEERLITFAHVKARQWITDKTHKSDCLLGTHAAGTG